MNAVPVRVAARTLGVTPRCIRAWLHRGAPAVSQTRPVKVDVDALRAWRVGADPLAVAAVELLNTLRRELAQGEPAHVLLGIPAPKAAVLLLATYDRLHLALAGKPSAEPWHPSIAALRAIAAKGMARSQSGQSQAT